MCAHSSAGMMRGTGSIGQTRSIPSSCAVDGEADAVLQHGQVGHRLAAAELLGGEPAQPVVQRAVVRPRAARRASNISS